MVLRFERCEDYILEQARKSGFDSELVKLLNKDMLFRSLSKPDHYGQRDTATSRKLSFTVHFPIPDLIHGIFQDDYGIAFVKGRGVYGGASFISQIFFTKKYIEPFSKDKNVFSMNGEFELMKKELIFEGIFHSNRGEDIIATMKRHDYSNPQEVLIVERLYNQNMSFLMGKLNE